MKHFLVRAQIILFLRILCLISCHLFVYIFNMLDLSAKEFLKHKRNIFSSCTYTAMKLYFIVGFDGNFYLSPEIHKQIIITEYKY